MEIIVSIVSATPEIPVTGCRSMGWPGNNNFFIVPLDSQALTRNYLIINALQNHVLRDPLFRREKK